MSIDTEINNTSTIQPVSIETSVTTGSVPVVDSTKDLQIEVNRKEYSIVGDELYIPKRYEEAPQWMRDLIDTVVEIGLASKLSDLNTLEDVFDGLIAELDVAKNTYTQSIISSNDIDERINTAITTLNSALADSDATILDIANTKVTPDEALAIATGVLSASINGGDIAAAINTLQTAIATEEEARALDYTNLEAAIAGGLEDEATARANAISILDTKVLQNENAIAANAEDITTLTTEVNNGTTTWAYADSMLSNTLTTKIENDDAIVEGKFEYGSNVTINGITQSAGFGLVNELSSVNGAPAAGQSEFWINADKFKFTNASNTGTNAPFTIDATGSQPSITFNGKVTFGSGQTGTIDEAIASTVNTIAVGDKNINITDNLIPTTSLVADTNNSGYQFVGTPTKGNVAGIDTFAEPQVALAAGDEVYSPYVDEVTLPYYYRFGFKATNTDLVKIVTIDASDVVTYSTLTVQIDTALVAGDWYIVDGIINPNGGDATNYNGTIRAADGTRVGSLRNFALPSGAVRLLLGWYGACTISRMKLAKVTADTLTGSYVTQEYVDKGIANSGYVLPEGVADAINNNITTVDGSKITTGTINADKINTIGLIADSINATSIIGNDIVGSSIKGANIIGSVIKASYLDLDGELEVLTNYHIPVSTYNTNPSLYPDAIYVSGSNEYRLPSLSSVSEVTANVNTMSAGGVVYGKIRSYNTADAGHNVKAVKLRPTFSSAAHQIYSVSGVQIQGPIGPATYYYADFSYRLGTVELVRVRISTTFGAIGPVVSITTPYGTGVTHQYNDYDAATLNATNIPILGSITVTCTITYPRTANWAFVVSCGGGIAELPFDWSNTADKINIYMNQSSIGSTLKLTPSIIINNMI